jgi:hypothetical protein
MTPDAALEQAYLRAGRMLSQFTDPARIAERLDLVVALRPRFEDYAQAFQPDSVEIARAGYTVLWKQPPIWPIALDQTALRLAVCLSEELGPYTGKAQAFPRGYQTIAHHLLPGRIWCAWEFLRPSAQDGLAFDGLVVFDDHFAWFPKPWRVLPTAPKT